jgi:hypothetical protein
LISDPKEFVSTVYEAHNLVERSVESIEVRVTDVARIFCTSGSPVDAKPAEGSLEAVARKSKKILAILQACDALWPEGVSEGLSAKDRNQLINDWLKARKLSIPSPRTIERALALRPRVR